MAPFARGRSRGIGRGRSASRGGVRGNNIVKGGHTSTFYSTRVEEQVNDVDPPEGSRISSDDEHDSDAANDLSSVEDLEHEQSTANSYSTLLESLNASIRNGPPKRKRRKIDLKVPDKASRIGSHEKPSDEQDRSEDMQKDLVNDHSDADEANAVGEIEGDVEDEVEESRFS